MKQPINNIIFSLFFLSFSAFALPQNLHPFAQADDAARFTVLTQEIRCVVCQNQNIADSNAPLANDLREKVYHMVLAQQSDEQIKDYLVQRYGEFILLKPRVNNATIILWAFPLIGLLAALFLLLRVGLRKATYR